MPEVDGEDGMKDGWFYLKWMAKMKWMGRMVGFDVVWLNVPKVDGSDGMNGKDDWIACYVWLNVPEVDGEDGMNVEDGWIECYV